MMLPPFLAKSKAEEAQLYLFASAYWVLSADEKLTTDEWRWLFEQFGEARAREMLDTFMAMPDGEYFTVLGDSLKRIPAGERQVILANMNDWLLSCAMADGSQSIGEYEIAELVKEQAERFADAEVSSPAAAGEQAALPAAATRTLPQGRCGKPGHRRREPRVPPGGARKHSAVLEEILSEAMRAGEIPYQATRRAQNALITGAKAAQGAAEIDAMLDGMEPFIDLLTELKEEAQKLDKLATRLRCS